MLTSANVSVCVGFFSLSLSLCLYLFTVKLQASDRGQPWQCPPAVFPFFFWLWYICLFVLTDRLKGWQTADDRRQHNGQQCGLLFEPVFSFINCMQICTCTICTYVPLYVCMFVCVTMTQQHFVAALLVILAPNCMQIAHNCYVPPTFKFSAVPAASSPSSLNVMAPYPLSYRIQLAGSSATLATCAYAL